MTKKQKKTSRRKSKTINEPKTQAGDAQPMDGLVEILARILTRILSEERNQK
jgi:hypothetical protein